jgi:putative membrane protein
MAEPVQVDEHVVFPVATYGSAMAALFTNLSLWIGAFVLMVIFKLEVDTEGLEAVSLTSAYLGRWLLFAILVVLQAILVCVGDLVIGVQTVNAFAFIGTGVLISIAYLSIIYGLSVTFGYVGKGLCIVLVIMQIPGASGLYPIEMMPGFFRALYPLFPFTYGIDALRETIGGFYGAHYWGFLGALAVFVAVAFLLGIALRRSLVNLTLMFNTRVAETGLLSSERVQGYRGRFRLSRILFALSSNREFRQQVASRKRLMNVRYPVILRTTVIVVLVGGLMVALLGGFGVIGKATQLGLWVALLLIMFAVFVGLEYGRDRLDAAFELSTMTRTELQETLFAGGSDHNSAELSSPVAVSPASAEHEAEEASDSTEIDTAVTVKSGDDDAVLDDDTDSLEILKSLFAQDSAEEQSADTLHEPDEPTSDSGGDDEGSSS